jgi:hypothetical protein
MTNFETFYYFFGVCALYAGIIFLLLYNWYFIKRKKNKFRHYLIRKKSKCFSTWCVVVKRKNCKNDVELPFLTKFFAKRAVKKLDNWVRRSHPLLTDQACGGFMYKKVDNQTDIVQLKNPRSNRYVKIDRAKGRILSHKKSEGAYKGIII